MKPRCDGRGHPQRETGKLSKASAPMASGNLWGHLEDDSFESDFNSFMHGLRDLPGSSLASGPPWSPSASPPPPSMPETALPSARGTPHGAAPASWPAPGVAWPTYTVVGELPTAAVVVAPGNGHHMFQPGASLAGFMVPAAAAVPSACSDDPSQGAQPWLRYRCRYPGCNRHYASTDGVRKHCRKKVRACILA